MWGGVFLNKREGGVGVCVGGEGEEGGREGGWGRGRGGWERRGSEGCAGWFGTDRRMARVWWVVGEDGGETSLQTCNF